ncbi:MAG TPA: Xaa-Pro peptidase family protein [Gemmatimonadales bacterium]|nr:Xaa-Pro peptidase family protein [Gemmatimonadales bacterium]
MERRQFIATTTGWVVTAVAGRSGGRPVGEAAKLPTAGPHDRPSAQQEPSLSTEVFARRIQRVQAELTTQKLDFLIVTPSTNYEYFTGYNPGRSERLITCILPVAGAPVVVCPAFEVDRVKSHSAIPDVRGWEEQENPYKLVKNVVRALKPRGNGTIALEATTAYQVYLQLADQLGGWKFVDAAPVTERLRIVKAPEEVALIRRAIEITEAALAVTFAQLAAGMTERDVAQLLSREMQQRGAPGGGLVQFGPSSALPHGGPAAATLERETVVLIDGGCRVLGYTSDITRTIWFGDTPSDEFKKVFNLVHDAQTAALELGRPLFTRCQELDRAARKVIGDGGYGRHFTHRLGHGLGMDGHEVPYLVEGSDTRLEPGMVFTIEPGIYQPGKFGVRIEDDCLMTEGAIEVLSHRPAKL